jgi:hypothetical protein
LSFCFACKKTEENKLISNENEINFCSLVEIPQKYNSRIIQTKAIVLGYHTFIFYNSQCLEEPKVLALEVNYESRSRIIQTINADKRKYKADFLNNNLYAEIIVLGEIKQNDEKKEAKVFHPEYKFFVNEIKEVNILSEEIYPRSGSKRS